MNKFTQFLFIILALVLATAISLFTYRSLTQKPVTEQTAAREVTESIVVAAVDIARGSEIENSYRIFFQKRRGCWANRQTTHRTFRTNFRI